jgi:hypothetical protein
VGKAYGKQENKPTEKTGGSAVPEGLRRAKIGAFHTKSAVSGLAKRYCAVFASVR